MSGTNYILPQATSTTLGGVTVPNNSGLSVSSGAVKVSYGTGQNTALQGSTLGQANGPASLDSGGKIPTPQLLNLGSAAFLSSSAFDSSGTAAASVAAIPLSGSAQTQPALIKAVDWATFNGKQSALGFAPENSANKGLSGGYASLNASGQVPSAQLPIIPTKTSQLINDAAFVNGTQAASGAPVQSVNGQIGLVSLAIPTKTSQLTNDAGYVTATTAPVTSVNSQTGAITVVSNYQTIQNNGTGQTPRNSLNLKPGPNLTLSFADNPSNNSTDVTFAAANGNYTLPQATSTTLGGVTLPSNSGLSVSSGAVSVSYGTSQNTALQGSTLGQANGPASLDSSGKIPTAQLLNLGSAAFLSSSAFDSSGAAAAAVAAIPLSGSAQTQPALIKPIDWATFNGKQPALGFTPENSANRNAANGYAGLDPNGLLPWVQLSGVPIASSSKSGTLSSSDWNTFNAKQAALGFTPENTANRGLSGGYASLNVSGQVPSTQLPLIPSKTSQLTNDAGYVTASTAPVTSVNGQTGAITVGSNYQIIRNNGAAQTPRNSVNLKPGPNLTLSFADNPSSDSTDVTLTAASGGNGSASPNVFYTDSYSGSVSGAVSAAIAAGGGNVYIVTPGTYVLASTLAVGSASTRVHLYLGQRVVLNCTMTDGSNCIVIWDGSGIHGSGPFTASPLGADGGNGFVTINSGAHVANMIVNAIEDGTQQTIAVDGIGIIGPQDSSTHVDQAMLHLRGLFSGTWLANISTGNMQNTIGLLMDTPGGQTITPTSVAGSGTTATVTVAASPTATPDGHNVWPGGSISVAGCSDTVYNGTRAVVNTASNTVFTYTTSGAITNAAPSGCSYHLVRAATSPSPGGAVQNITSVIHASNLVISGSQTGARPVVLSSNNFGSLGDLWNHSWDIEGGTPGGAIIEINGNGCSYCVGDVDFFGMRMEGRGDSNAATIGMKIHDASNINAQGVGAGNEIGTAGQSVFDISGSSYNINITGITSQGWSNVINNHLVPHIVSATNSGSNKTLSMSAYHYAGKNWDGTPAGAVVSE